MITLGGYINLHGIETIDPAEQLIIKKMIGSYVRRICDELEGCQQADITFSNKEGSYHITAEAIINDKKSEATEKGENIFITLDKALKKLLAGYDVRM